MWTAREGGRHPARRLPEYQRRGDLEIWRIHPYDHTLTAWRRQPDGSYAESLHEHRLIQPVALPGVTVNLDTLFE
jgi:Uma2 family endonuclease